MKECIVDLGMEPENSQMLGWIEQPTAPNRQAVYELVGIIIICYDFRELLILFKNKEVLYTCLYLIRDHVYEKC